VCPKPSSWATRRRRRIHGSVVLPGQARQDNEAGMNAAQDDIVKFCSDSLTLAGTFVEAQLPTAAALILVGSGKIDRNSNTRRLRTGVTAAIAGALQDAHVSSLRFDKRGVGASEGDFLRAGIREHRGDARAALAWLAARTDDLPLFVVGHSEGALHAAHLAGDTRIAGAVLISAPARSGEQVIIWQLQEIIPTLPRPIRAIMKLLRSDPAKTQRKRFAQFRGSSSDVIRIHGRRFPARWWREFLDYDPAPILARVKVPILAVTGAHDLQVPPEDTETICRLVKGPCSAHIVDGVSHLLRPDPNRQGPRDYRRAVRKPVDPGVLALVTEWISRKACGENA
jgi:uncharacterized protein